MWKFCEGGDGLRLMDRRANERAMHESFVVIKVAPNDLGSRPLNGSFASPELNVGPDGRPRAVVWNLGTREVRGVITEFAAIPAGKPVTPENKIVIGFGNPANIMANSSVQVTCNGVWLRSSPADVLLVTACHPETDPVKAPCDPLSDRHVGQMNYAWAGGFEGILNGVDGGKIGIQIRPANQGLYRVKVFVADQGRMPTHPQADRTMKPNGATFRWQDTYSFKKEDWLLTMLDNQRMSVKYKVRYTDNSGRPEQEWTGLVNRA